MRSVWSMTAPRHPVRLTLAIGVSAMAGDIALNALTFGATFYLERCAAAGPWLNVGAFWSTIGEHFRAFPCSSIAMLLGCAVPGGTPSKETTAMALRSATMIAAMPVLCALGLRAAAWAPRHWEVATYLATMLLLSGVLDHGLRACGRPGPTGWRRLCS